MAETRQMYPGVPPASTAVLAESLTGLFPQMLWGRTDGVAGGVDSRTGGTPIVNVISRVTSVAGGVGVTLGGANAKIPIGGGGWVICNVSGSTLHVYPPGASDVIDGFGGGASVSLSSPKTAFFLPVNNSAGVLTIVSMSGVPSS